MSPRPASAPSEVPPPASPPPAGRRRPAQREQSRGPNAVPGASPRDRGASPLIRRLRTALSQPARRSRVPLSPRRRSPAQRPVPPKPGPAPPPTAQGRRNPGPARATASPGPRASGQHRKPAVPSWGRCWRTLRGSGAAAVGPRCRIRQAAPALRDLLIAVAILAAAGGRQFSGPGLAVAVGWSAAWPDGAAGADASPGRSRSAARPPRGSRIRSTGPPRWPAIR